MLRHTLAHLSDETLLRDLSDLVARERATTAEVLAHIAEVDARQLYLPAGRSSMHTYCVQVLRLSDDAAYKRIQAARAGRQFPVLFDAIADGRLHLAGACLLAPHLTPQNVTELLALATYRRKSEIEVQLARMFPSTRASEPAATVRVLPAIRSPLAPGQVEHGPAPQLAFGESGDPSSMGAMGRSERSVESSEGRPSDSAPVGSELAPGQVGAGQVGARSSAPSHAERYLVRLTIGRDLYDKLRYAQALLSHAVPSGDVAEVLERALDTLIAQVERRKIGSRTRSRTFRRIVQHSRYIPASVREAVWDRDQSRCTFVGANGHRCEARRFLQFDHVKPFARGGKPTVDGLRLRCWAHNQYLAELTFGSEFMSRKRAEARQARTRKDLASSEAVEGEAPRIEASGGGVGTEPIEPSANEPVGPEAAGTEAADPRLPEAPGSAAPDPEAPASAVGEDPDPELTTPE